MLMMSQVIEMNHTSTIRLPGVSVWSECLTASREHHCGLLISNTPYNKHSDSFVQIQLCHSQCYFQHFLATRQKSIKNLVFQL